MGIPVDKLVLKMKLSVLPDAPGSGGGVSCMTAFPIVADDFFRFSPNTPLRLFALVA